MPIIALEAEQRNDIGKGASRRLRRLENKIPAIIYGSDEGTQSIVLSHNKVRQALEQESIYSSVFDLNIAGKTEHVILKAIQRHPFKPVIMHMDLQRVSAKDIIVKNIPLHFINEETSKGVKAGGRVSHAINQIEIRCQVKDLPEFIEVDLAKVELNQTLHLSDLKIPKGLQLTTDFHDPAHNHPVATIYNPKTAPVEASDLDETAETETPEA